MGDPPYSLSSRAAEMIRAIRGAFFRQTLHNLHAIVNFAIKCYLVGTVPCSEANPGGAWGGPLD